MAHKMTFVYKASVVNLGHANMSHGCKHTRKQRKQNKIKQNKIKLKINKIIKIQNSIQI